jgi:PST family polysaccharide transporter
LALARDAARGALLSISSGMGARAIGLVSTLLLARFLAPGEYGEVTVAAVLVMTATQLSTLGLGQFLVAEPRADRSTAFHATAYHLLSGVVALGTVLAGGHLLGRAFDAPEMTRFLPGLVAAALCDRIAYVPERLLVRELRFGMLSGARTGAELAYSIASVLFAALGWGAAAVVAGNVARSLLRSTLYVAAVKRRDWLDPTPLTLAKTRELFAFGVPMALGASCSFAARRWDNLLVSRFFGPGPVGAYNLAYNLADVPAIQVGEQIGDVLLPSFARLEPSRRAAALLRSMALLGLVVFPLAVGLGAVAPTLVAVLFDQRWRSIGPMLVLLSALSVTRPVGWTVASYLQALQRPGLILWLELLKLVCLIAGIVTFGRWSPLWTCAAVGLAFALHALASLVVVSRVEAVSLRESLGSLLPALGACVPMVAAVLALRTALAALGEPQPWLSLALQVAAGGFGYVAGALVFARRTSEDLLERLVDALRSRRTAS